MSKTSVTVLSLALIGILLTSALTASAVSWPVDGPATAVAFPPTTVADSAPGTGTSARDTGVQDWKSAALTGYLNEVQAVDIDADAQIELVGILTDSNNVQGYVYIFDGKTHAQEFQSAALTGTIDWFQVGQMDADAALEIAVRTDDWNNQLGEVHIFDGTTHAETFLSATTGVLGSDDVPAVLDVDNDGAIEVVVKEMDYDGLTGNWINEHIVIYNAGTGTVEWISPIEENFEGFAVGNADGDAAKEIAIVSYDWSAASSPGNVTVYDGSTHLLQKRIGPLNYIDTASWFGGIVLADVDGDGSGDLLTSEQDYITWGIGALSLYNAVTGAQTWTYAETASLPRVGDADSDGKTEVAFIDSTQQVQVLDGATKVNEWTSALPGGVFAFSSGRDYDGDTKNDLLLAEFGGKGGVGFTWYLYNGAGPYTQTWKAPNSYDLPAPFPGSTASDQILALAGDYDQDGVKDLLFRSQDQGWFGNPKGNLVLLNAINGSEIIKTADMGIGQSMFSHTSVGDVTGSGHSIMAAAEFDGTTGAGTVKLFNLPAGNQAWSSADIDAWGVWLVDLDKDGKLETFAAGSDGTTMQSYFYVFHLDLSPTPTAPIPDINLPEDTDQLHALQLSTYFTDDYDAAVLTYTVSFESSPSQVKASIDADWLNLDNLAPDWNGNCSIRIDVADTKNAAVTSNEFKVFVTPVNDAPTVTAIPDQTLTEGQHFTYQLIGADKDGDTVTWSSNSTLIAVNGSTGKIDLTPTNDDIGVRDVTFTATDPSAATGTMAGKFTIENVNQPPVLDLPKDPVPATEGSVFSFQVVATDPDLPWGDTLRFTEDSANFAIDVTDGSILFTPTNSMVGLLIVHVGVKDSLQVGDTGTLLIQVADLNTAPIFVDEIQDKTIDEGQAFQLEVEAFDEDLGDTLTFGDDTPLFSVTKLGGTKARVAFTPGDTDVGVWPVNLTVTDSFPHTTTAHFTVTVRNTNDPPQIVRPDDKVVTEDVPFSIQLVLKDPDLPYGDHLTATVDPDWMSLDLDTGLLTGTATNDEVGDNNVVISITDTGFPQKGSATASFTLTVENANDAPVITAIVAPPEGARLRTLHVNVEGKATDVDVGDALTYTWFEGVNELGKGQTATLNLGAGKHTVTLKVTDKLGAEATKDVTFTIEAIGGGVGGISSNLLVMLLVLAIVGGVVGLLIWQRAKRGKSSSVPTADAGLAQAAAAPPPPPPGAPVYAPQPPGAPGAPGYPGYDPMAQQPPPPGYAPMPAPAYGMPPQYGAPGSPPSYPPQQ